MRIALAQLNPVSGDIDGNTRALIARHRRGRGARRRCRRGAGDGPPRLLHRRPDRGPRLSRGQRAGDAAGRRGRRRGITAVAGFIDCDYSARSDTGTMRKYNAAAVVRDGRVLQRARKTLLPNYRYFDDRRFFTPAERREAGRRPDGRAGRPASASRSAKTCGTTFYDVKPLPRARRQGRRRHPQSQRLAVLSRQAARAGRTDPPAHRTGPPAGGLRQHRRRGRQRQEHHPVRRREPGLRRSTPGSIAIGRQFAEDLLIVDLDGRDAPGSSTCRRSIASASSTTRCMMALGDYMRKTGFTRATVAVSGGIDSALALALAVDALGAGQVTAFNMPSKSQHRDDPLDCRASGRRVRRPLRRDPDPGASTTRSSPCSRSTPTRSRAA